MDVSIIVPLYNVAPYIEACLQSVMRQSYTGSMECLVVDDGSTDDSLAIVERLLSAYDGPIRFKILRHEQNSGMSAARNTGTLQAIGDYLYYIDSDDEISEDCIEKLMQKASEDPSIEMVQGNTKVHSMQKNDKILVEKIKLPKTETNEEARKCFYQYGQMNVNVWNKLLKLDFIIENNILCGDVIMYEDWLWTFYLLKHLKKACFVPDVTYHYKRRDGSITTGIDLGTSMASYRAVFSDMMSHLTPGHEKDEFDYYAQWITRVYFRNLSKEPLGFEDTIKLCMEKGRLYGSCRVRLMLAVLYCIDNFRYSWLLMEIFRKVRHPEQIISTFTRNPRLCRSSQS